MGDEASPRKCAQWYQALLQNVKMFDAMYRAVARNGPSISASKFKELDTIAMVILEARDNIVAADGVKNDVENAVQWVSLQMMKLKQILISSEDSSKQPNLKLLEVWEKSLNTLRSKSLNENVEKSSNDGHKAIFDMIQEHVWKREPQDVEEEQETYPARQKPLDDAIAKEETPDDDKTQASKSIFDMPDQLALEDKKLLEKEVLTEPKEVSDEERDGNEVTAMKPLQDFIENPVKPLLEVTEKPMKPIQDDEIKKPTDDTLVENFVKSLQDSV